jgi:hypothetical protein
MEGGEERRKGWDVFYKKTSKPVFSSPGVVNLI